MDNPASAPSSQEVRLPSKQEILNYFTQLRAVVKSYHRAVRAIAYYGSRIRNCEGWTVLGYESEDTMRLELDVPESTFYKWIKIGTMLPGLALEDLNSICTTNLELMTQIDTELWPEYPWVEDAKSSSPKEFASLITSRNLKNGNGREPMTYVKHKVPYSAKEMIDKTVKKFQDDHNIATPGRALELLLAENHDRPALLAGFVEIRGMLGALVELMQKHCIVVPELYDAVENIRTVCAEKVTEAIQAARSAKGKQDDRGRQDQVLAECGRESGAPAPQMDDVERPAHLSRLQ